MNVSTDANVNPCGSESSSTSDSNGNDGNGVQKESKLELFGFDSLVNILGLRRYNMPPLVLLVIVSLDGDSVYRRSRARF